MKRFLVLFLLLSCTVAFSQKKKQTGVGFEEIAVIAAEKASRGVVVANLPPRIRRIVPGKQCLLNASGQVEFALQSIPFLVCQIIETKIQEWVGIRALNEFMLVTAHHQVVVLVAHGIVRKKHRHEPMEPNDNGNWPGPCAVPFPPDTRKTD